MQIVLTPWKILEPKIVMLFLKKHSYLFLPGVKGHQHPGTTLAPGPPPALATRNTDVGICPREGLRRYLLQLTLGPGNSEASLLSEKLYFTSDLLVCSEGVPQNIQETLCRSKMLTYIFQRSW